MGEGFLAASPAPPTLRRRPRAHPRWRLRAHFLQQTATSALQLREAKERVQRLFRITETGEVLAATNTKARRAARRLGGLRTKLLSW